MQIDEILEENSIPSIHKKTRISVENLTKIFARDFTGLKKVQAYGFLSILEREYNVDIGEIKAECEAYFGSLENSDEAIIAYPPPAKNSYYLWIWLFLIGVLVAIGWYFLRESYTSLIANSSSKEAFVAEVPALIDEDIVASLTPQATSNEVEDVSLADTNDTNESNVTNTQVADTDAGVDFIHIIPAKKLWFGTVNLETKAVADKIANVPFEFDLAQEWLVATSVAPFTMKSSTDEQNYSDTKSHYFHINKFGAKEITKDEFVSLGGPKKW